MNYTQFKNDYRQYPVIFSRDLVNKGGERQGLLNQLNRWQEKKLIIQLRRGMYLLNKNDRKSQPSRLFLANQLYNPSYVSLEYALHFYDLIPERVTDITSVTTKKTAEFDNEEGRFVYQHIKPDSFRGFKSLKDEGGLTYFIAEPEKALVDYFYLNLKQFKEDDRDIFEGSLRLQNVERLSLKKLRSYTELYNNKKLKKVVNQFCLFKRDESAK